MITGLQKIAIGILCGIILWFLIWSQYAIEDLNSKLLYGDTWYPKNCRAIIKVNIDGFRSWEYSVEEIIDSIDRNCGEFGYSWDSEK